MTKPPGRPSRFTEPMRVEIARRLATGEGIRALAREYKIPESSLRHAFSAHSAKIKDAAIAIVASKKQLEMLPIPAQKAALSLADHLNAIQDDYAKTAKDGAKTARILSGKAVKLAEAMDEPEPETLKVIGALHQVGNEALKPAMALVAANKGSVEAEQRGGVVIVVPDQYPSMDAWEAGS